MNDILGYDCDGNEIIEYRILRFPFSADIDNWDEEENVDPRFYCAIVSSDGKYWAVSVYEDYMSGYIRKFEKIKDLEGILIVIKQLSEMEYYEVAFSGITGDEWYYDRDKLELKNKVELLLKSKKKIKKDI